MAAAAMATVHDHDHATTHPLMRVCGHKVMAWSQDTSDGDGPIKRLNDTTPNDTADITPHRTTPTEAGYRLKTSAKQNPGMRTHDTGRQNPPDKPHTRFGRLTSLRPTTSKPTQAPYENSIEEGTQLWYKQVPHPPKRVWYYKVPPYHKHQDEDPPKEPPPQGMTTPLPHGNQQCDPPKQVPNKTRQTEELSPEPPAKRNPGMGTHDARPQGPQTNHTPASAGVVVQGKFSLSLQCDDGNPPNKPPTNDKQPLYAEPNVRPWFKRVLHTHFGSKLRLLNDDPPQQTPGTQSKRQPNSELPSHGPRPPFPLKWPVTSPPSPDEEAEGTTHPLGRWHTHLSRWYHTPAQAGQYHTPAHADGTTPAQAVLNMQMGNWKARLGRPQIYV
ncbi:hypothetical protein BS47DRAFT_1370039 [Hydnum rufescens UP504]|uniref:Uncharacterized protein n=1 Tax=Hydnum rufescens UP504 TaxID=1448309 RepID=A0A9P6ABC4_9AGAM|nr:hypothetical protein BS47DRAFT_1370039 [Hydnum rufescens UP504]